MTHARLKMLAIGKATQDVFLTDSDVFKPKKENGISYQHLPLGAKIDLDGITFATGGNATNAAVTFARQGLHAQYMWALGTDPASQAIMAELDGENVDMSGVVQADEYKASYSTVLLAPTGERTILNFHGTMVHPDGHPLDLERIAGADWLYLSSLGTMELLEKVVSFAAKHGVKVALNPAGTELAKPDQLKTILEDVEILLLNKEEMQVLVEGQSLEELARHGTHYCKTVVVSDGPRGVVATDGETVVRGGLYEDVPVIDRTGAGDAFGSGFVATIAAGGSLRDAVVFASANSTSVVGKIGAKAGILHQGTELHDMPLHIMPF
jgi:sugar/nucleoside kinase (ribokinase family)